MQYYYTSLANYRREDYHVFVVLTNRSEQHHRFHGPSVSLKGRRDKMIQNSFLSLLYAVFYALLVIIRPANYVDL